MRDAGSMWIAGTVIGMSWVVYLAYWLLQSMRANRAESIRASGGNAAWLLANVVLFAILARFGYHLRVGSAVLRPAGATVVLAGLVLSIAARRTLARNWSKDVALVAGQELVTTGVYARLRHPIYAGFLLMAAGTALFLETVGVVLLVALLATFLLVKARREEELLAREFPESYPAYRQRTNAIIPFLY